MKKHFKVCSLLLSFLISSCAPYNFFKIYHAEYKINSFNESSLFNDKEFYNTFFECLIEDTNTALREKEENSLFSPISFYNNIALISLTSSNGLKYMNKFGYDSEFSYESDFKNISKLLLSGETSDKTYFRSINHLEYLNIKSLNEDYLEKIGKKYEISSFNYPLITDFTSYTMEFIKNVAGMEVEISPETFAHYVNGAFAFNNLKIKDSFSSSRTTFKSSFRGRNVEAKDTDFISTSNSGKFINNENEKVYIFDMKINKTSLRIILPYEGVDINSINLNRLDLTLKDVEEVPLEIDIPLFELETKFEDYSYLLNKYDINFKSKPFDKTIKTVTGDSTYFSGESSFISYQMGKFKLDENGIEGEATSISGEGNKGTNEIGQLYLNVDRPFYAISMYQDLPLFVNKVLTL